MVEKISIQVASKKMGNNLVKVKTKLTTKNGRNNDKFL